MFNPSQISPPINVVPPSNPHPQTPPLLFRDPSSNLIFNKMASEELRKRVANLEVALSTQVTTTQMQMNDWFTSEQFLQGLMLPDEFVDEQHTLLLQEIYCKGWGVPCVPKSIAQLTNKRLLLLKVERGERATLTKEKPQSFFVRDQYNISNQVHDGNFFYPIPLSNITGISFRTSWDNSGSQSIQRRSSMIIFGLFCLFVFATLASVPFLIFKDIGNMTLSIVVICILALCAVGLLIGFFVYNHYRTLTAFFIKSPPERYMEVGFRDPLTQQQLVAQLWIDQNYSLQNARTFLCLLQQRAKLYL